MHKIIPRDSTKQKLFLDALQATSGLVNDTFGKDGKKKASGQLTALFSKAQADFYKPIEAKKALFTGTSSDLPQMNTNSFDVIQAGLEYDLDWMLAFKERPVDEGKNFFEIATIDNGIGHTLVPEGGKLKLDKMSGSKVIVFVNKYGTGIQWTDEMIRYRQLGAMLEVEEAAVESHWAGKADRCYSLLTASSSATTAYQTSTGNSQLDNDIDTLNKAYTDLVEANKDKFRGLKANVEALLYLPINAKTRIERAMRKLINDVAGSQSVIPWSIRPVYTLNENIPAAATGDAFRGLLVLPGRKIQMAQPMPVTFYNDFEILSLSHIQAGWEYFGAGVAETTQVRTVRFG